MLDQVTAPSLKTPITELFGIQTPIVAGGLQWLADAAYVAAVGRAGSIGFVTAASFAELSELRDEIRKCRDLCDGKPFGVNVSMLPKLVQGEKTQQVFDLIVEEGVKFVETSGRNPEPYLPPLKAAGIKVIHKVPAVRYALKAQSIGVDAVSIVGAECGGHPGMDMVGSFVNAAMAASVLDIPYLIGGGVGHGSQIIAALSMGAGGVVIGTRFLVAEELWACDAYKQVMVAANERDTVLTMSSVRNTIRTLKNQTTEAVSKIEQENPEVTIQQLLPLVSGKIGRQAYETGDCSRGLLSMGHAVVFADRVAGIAQIVEQLNAEAQVARARLLTI
jgi:nitronate monooxygenase|tara:strand:+ start:215 stop:1213 length:999 start_codon:yes stop_codon:yes gene_type:complete